MKIEHSGEVQNLTSEDFNSKNIKSHEGVIQEFDEVIHNSEIFDVLDTPHVVEDNFKTGMDKEQIKKYVTSKL